MRLPVDWIREYAPTDLPLRELADVLTNVGLEVEAIEEAAGVPVLEIKVTPNRGDCLSLVGVARELAMALRVEARLRDPVVTETGPPTEELVAVAVEDPTLCPRYSARVVRGVRIGPSPEWAQRRLEQCGFRAINNVVDATNLVMLELGQPLHAFDFQLLRAGPGEARPTIIVRRARPRERLVTIDGEERALDPEVLVIADPGGAIALAGIMGGSSTEIHEGTTEVLLESAHFDPGIVRRGARALGMSTEASYRFERVVDPGGTVRALDRACELIAEFCDQSVEVARGVVDAYPNPIRERAIRLRPELANALLGLSLPTADIAEHLRRLHLRTNREGEHLLVVAPTFRQDIQQEIDLVEEVARAAGYDAIPETLPERSVGVGRLPSEVAFERRVRGLMLGLGLSETVTPSLESPDALARLGLPEGHPLACPVALSNAKTVDRSQLRTTLLTSLLEVAAHNSRHGVSDLALFDLGRVYWSRGQEELPEQPQRLAILGAGVLWRGRWQLPRGAERWDFYALKGLVEALLQAVAHAPGRYQPTSAPYLQAGEAAQVFLSETAIGELGRVSTAVCQAWDLPGPVYSAELDLEALRRHQVEAPQYQPVSRYPAVTRDVAFLLAREVPAQQAEDLIAATAGPHLESLSLFDAFEGKPLPAGLRNLAFSLSFRAPDRTLTDDEVEAAMDRVRARLREALGAQIRE